MSKIRVLIIKDHQVVLGALEEALSAYEDMEVVGKATSFEDSLTKCVQFSPDVVIVDDSLPHVSPLETIIRLKTSCGRQVRKIVFSLGRDTSSQELLDLMHVRLS